MTLSLNEVFGVRPKISEHSYIDRGKLDEELRFYASSPTHIAMRGESKSGKSWLRQKIFPKANIISCRIDTNVADIYRQVMANLDISISLTKNQSLGVTLRLEGTGEAGWAWLAKATGKVGADGTYKNDAVGHFEKPRC